jgi:hypothetical protein
MKKTMLAVVATCVFVGIAGRAHAQTPPPTKNAFLDVNFGFQVNSQTITISSTPTIYGEIAFIDSSQKISGSPFIDVSGGYRVWKDFSIGLGVVTTFNKSSDSTVSASIPSPIFFDRRIVTTSTVSNLEHKERSAALLFGWTTPISDKLDATVTAGPAYIKVFQGLVANVDVVANSQTSTPRPEVQTATKIGFSIGGDITYLVTPRVGVGGVARYLAAKADLASVSDLKVGGFQVGGGLRVRF